MALLEQVSQLKNQGIGDPEIVDNLQQQGYAPQEISDALNQLQVKNAVSGEEMSAPVNYDDEYSPQPQEAGEGYASQDGYAPQETPNAGYAQQSGYQDYGGGYAPNAPSTSADNIIEIAEQVFTEKIKKLDKKVNDINEIKTLMQSKVESLDDRLKRIEKLIDQLQIQILDKIGNYGRDLSKTKKELSMVQDSFGKMVNKIADKAPRKIQSQKKTSKKK